MADDLVELKSEGAAVLTRYALFSNTIHYDRSGISILLRRPYWIHVISNTEYKTSTFLETNVLGIHVC